MPCTRPLGLILILAGCASHPVDMVRVHPQGAPELSSDCRRTLDALGLSETEPAKAAQMLRHPRPAADDAGRLLARAEILYRLAGRAKSGEAAQRFLDSALAAHAALEAHPTQGLDPVRFRALTAYNDALARFLSARLEGVEDNVAAHLGTGNARVDVVWELTTWGVDAFDRWYVAGEFAFEGIRNRHRRAGIGVPLILARSPSRGIPRYLTPEQVVRGATAILEPAPGRPRLRLVDPARQATVDTAGIEATVAADFTAPFAYLLANANLHELENSSFFEADAKGHEGLFLLEDYDPDRTPVVMVHGLWSSPFTWRELTNEVFGDPVLRRHYQVWHYMYATGAPLLENARHLRNTLTAVRRDLDPELDDPAMQGIVLVGHSMGGLLSRITLQSSGHRIWNVLYNAAPEELGLSPDDCALARELYFFESLDFVRRAIFIAAPHRGSDMADSFLGRLGSAMMTVPSHLTQLVDRIRASRDDVVRVEVPTSVDELSGSHAVMVELSDLPIRDGVPYHSIMGNVTGDPKNRSDGVVPYESSALPGASSELVVPGADHSVHMDARAVAEVRRILREAIQ